MKTCLIRSHRLHFAICTIGLLWIAGMSVAPAQGLGIRERRAERRAERAGTTSEEPSTKANDPELTSIEKKHAGGQFTLGPGDYTREIESGGMKRQYDLHVPKSYSKDKPMPIVLNFHGGGGNPMQQRRDSEMDATADKNDFIVLYGAGTGGMMGKFLTWNIGMSDTYATKHNVDDSAYVKAVLADVGSIFSVDSKRVYATGYSQGGMLCYQLACTMSDKIAAIAPVAATMQVPEADRKPTRPMPIIAFHGMKDDHVSYAGGTGANAHDQVDRPSVESSLAWWAKYNGVSTTPTAKDKKGNAGSVEYGSSGKPGDIVLWKLEDGGHTWPGGNSSLGEKRLGHVNRDIKASDVMWDFFSKYSL